MRDTGSASARTAHYAAHIDKYLPGIAASAGQAGARAGAEAFLREYWRINGPDWEREGLEQSHVADTIVADAAAAVNLWVVRHAGRRRRALGDGTPEPTERLGCDSLARVASPGSEHSPPPRTQALTPGGVAQSPLAVADTSSVRLCCDADGSAATVPVVFPGKLSDTLTLMRADGTRDARWLWRPAMRFGEVLLFSTTATPHTAVWLEGAPPARRVSAEIRLLVLGEK